MPIVNSEGTQTATVTTEHTLADLTANKHYAADIDLSEMIAGDVVEIRLYKKTRSAGTLNLKVLGTYADVQTESSVFVPWETPGYEWKLTLKQTVGTSRDFMWIVYEA